MQQGQKYAAVSLVVIGALGGGGYLVARNHYQKTGSASWYVPATIIGCASGLAVTLAVGPKISGCKNAWALSK